MELRLENRNYDISKMWHKHLWKTPQANEEKMREYFGKFGGLAEVNILKKENGKMVGCAFIQYKNPNHATKVRFLEAFYADFHSGRGILFFQCPQNAGIF